MASRLRRPTTSGRRLRPCAGLLLAGLLAVAVPVSGQPPRGLDDTAVAAIIADGGTTALPLELSDRGGLFSGAGSGYRITLHTPRSWVASIVRSALERRADLGPADLSAEDRALFLRVEASPSAPTLGGARELSSSVARILLFDETREISLAPEREEAHTTRHRRLIGSGGLTGMTALFSLEQVTVLRGDGDDEFFVRVEGTGYTKDFKIKRKHLEQLAW
jgi:hypothetical protein